jgi:DNA topoisomerase-3
MKILIVAEKDTVGKALAEALLGQRGAPGQDFILGSAGNDQVLITWTNGHIMALAEPEAYDPRWGQPWAEGALPIAPPIDGFRYEPKNPRLVSQISQWMGRSNVVINACDAAREGELIFHEILKYCGGLPQGTSLQRLWLNAVTPESITVAWATKENGYQRKFTNLLEAGMSRSHADWLWGLNMTRKVSLAFGRKYPREDGKTVFHVGRVQTPVLKIVTDRCDTIDAFKPEEFFRLDAEFVGSHGSFIAKIVAFKEMRYGPVDTHFRLMSDVVAMRKHLTLEKQVPWQVQDVKRTKVSPAPAPFDLDDLQQSANMIPSLRFTAKQTLEYAQRLYHEEGAISYPRTDSCFFPVADRDRILRVRDDLLRNWALVAFEGLRKIEMPPPTDNWFDDEKVTDHHGIMPTGVIPRSTDARGHTRPEYLLWELIVLRFIQAWFPDATILAAYRVLLRPYDELGTKHIRALLECSPVEIAGWMEFEDRTINTRGQGITLAALRKEKMFPDCEPKVAELRRVMVQPGRTTRPEFHSDAMLLREMKVAQLGTPATRASCIEDLIKKGYVERRDAGYLETTPDGRRLIAILSEFGGARLYDATMTASWESQIERMGKRVPDKPTRRSFLENINEQIIEIMGEIDGRKHGAALVLCPKTGNKVVLDPEKKKWLFGGPLKKADCYVNFRGRTMGAADYRDIFVAGAKGGGPFTFKKKLDQTEYEAWIIYRPNRRGYEQWELRFKSRGRSTRSQATPQ